MAIAWHALSQLATAPALARTQERRGGVHGRELVMHELWLDRRPQGYGNASEGEGGGWHALRQVVLLRTTRRFLDQSPRLPVVEEHFHLTSLPPSHKSGRASALLPIARKHWKIENGLHCVKDASMGEDASRNARASYGMS